MALPGIYRPSRNKSRNKTKREGPSPIPSQRRSHMRKLTKHKTNSNWGKRGAVKELPHLGRILSHYQMRPYSKGETTELLCRAVSSVSRQEREQTTRNQPTKNLPSGGEAERGGRPKHNTHHTTSHTEEERRGARRQQRTERERTHTHQKGYERALAGSKKGPRIIR